MYTAGRREGWDGSELTYIPWFINHNTVVCILHYIITHIYFLVGYFSFFSMYLQVYNLTMYT